MTARPDLFDSRQLSIRANKVLDNPTAPS